MRKLYFVMWLISCQVCQHLWGQQVSMSRQRLASHPVFSYNSDLPFINFYESIPPGDTIFRLSIGYGGYEDYSLSFLKSPVFRYVQELSISGPFDEVPTTITCLKQLKTLFLYNHHDVYGEGEWPLYIPNEVYHFPELEVLSVFTHNISISDSIINLKKLKHLYIPPVSLLPCLFTGMPQLRSINLNTSLPVETRYLNVCGKLLTFNNNTYSNPENWLYNDMPDDTTSKMMSALNRPINEKIDIKLKDVYNKRQVAFSFKGEIRNNEPIGPWTVKSFYSLLANYSNGKSNLMKVLMKDTIPLVIITKNNQGEEFQEFRNVKKQFRNSIPYGCWEYYRDGLCYKQIVFDDPEHPDPTHPNTGGYYIRKTYVKGQAYGTWTEVIGSQTKITEFKNGKPIKISDQQTGCTIPHMVTEFKYDQTESSVYTYRREQTNPLFLSSKESYKNYIPEGDFICYYRSGALGEKKIYVNGKITGDVNSYYENGKPFCINSYDRGLINHEKRFHQNGILAREVYYNAKGKHGTENTWSEKGKLKESTYYEHGLAFGVSQKFDDGGKLFSEKYYDNQGLKVYDEEESFDRIFIIPEKDRLFNFFYPLKMGQTLHSKDYTVQKKEINDSTFMLTKYQYTENRGTHLKYIKEFNFTNYKLSGKQVLKDSAGNIIQYVHCKSGLKDGKSTLIYRDDSLSVNYKRNEIIDTVLTYYIKRSRRTEIHYYKNMQLYKAEWFCFSHTGKSLENMIIEYVKAKQPKPADKRTTLIDKALALITNVPEHPNSMFFIPETLTRYLDGKKLSTTKFHATVTEADCLDISRVKGYAIVDGKKERFIEEDMSPYESSFRFLSVFNIFFNGMVTCYY